MKNIFSIIIVFNLTMACHSQKVLNNDVVASIGKNKNEYFSGTWKLIQKNYKEGGETKIFPLHPCMREYELVFSLKNELAYLNKVYATGANCAIKSQTDEILVTITDGAFQYIEHDLKTFEHYKIYSKNKFSIIYNDIIFGKVTEIEDVYEKK